MLIDKNTKQVMLGHTEIKRIMSEGGYYGNKDLDGLNKEQKEIHLGTLQKKLHKKK